MELDNIRDNIDILKIAKNVLTLEADNLRLQTKYLDENFIKAVYAIYKTKGKVFLTGIGKSGLIARKITATLSSTGTPAFFVHPAECYHGDIGVITPDDIGILFSFSGKTEEVVRLIPLFKRLNIKLIGISGGKDSPLLKNVDYPIYTPITKEACPLGIVPTSSTTVTLAIGDALAVSLIYLRGFSKEDFAKLHPGGTLGARLLTRVKDIMIKENLPLVLPGTLMKDAIITMTQGRLGVVGVIDKNKKLIGVITDGDLRRHIDIPDLLNQKVEDVMTPTPKTISENKLAVEALNLMEQYKITQLFVVDENNIVKGIIHIHNLIEAKIK